MSLDSAHHSRDQRSCAALRCLGELRGYKPRVPVNAIFRGCPVVSLPGHSRPLVRVADYLAFLEQHTYDGRSRVR